MTKQTDTPAPVALATPAEPATSPATDTVTVHLDEPLQRGSGAITQVTLRKPRAGSLRGLNLTDIAQMNVTALQKLLPRISEPTLTEQDVADMSPADLVACGVEVASFLLQKADRAAYQSA